MDAPVGNGSSDNAGANPMTAVPVAVASVRGNPIEPFFDSLSRELVVEILLRLPIKSVHCCRCVSKYWFSLISDPYFAHQYMHRQPKSLRAMSTLLVQEVPHRRAKDLTVYSTSKEQLFKFQGFSFSFLQEQSPTDSVYIIASCNDLVLCSDGFSKQSHYYICNPLTMQCVALPGPHPSRSQWNLTKLICDYCDDQGFTSTITRCNVVRIQQCRTFCHDNGSSTAGFYVENFSCETRQWSELSLWSPLGSRWIPSSVVVCNGMLYWLSHEQEIINGIVAFDPYNNSNGQCHFIDLPEDTNFYFESTFLGVWQGHLRVSHMLWHYCDLRVWELKDFFTGEWCLEHKVHLNQKVNKLYFDPSDGDVVYFSKDGEMFSFDMKSKKQKKVFSHANRSFSINAIPFLLLWPPTPVPMLQPKAIQR